MTPNSSSASSSTARSGCGAPFWTTPEQRRSNVLYHDCISFDSTFGTNRFRMPLVLFVGMDGEGRTVLLGAGAARGRVRQTDSTWLLRQLAAAGHGLTAISSSLDAIASVFPSTRHLLCAWHLSQSIIKAIAGPLGSSARDLMCAFSRCRKIEAADAFERGVAGRAGRARVGARRGLPRGS